MVDGVLVTVLVIAPVPESVVLIIASEVVVVVTFFDAPVPEADELTHTKVPVGGCVPTYFLKAEPLIVTSVKVGGLLGHAVVPDIFPAGFESAGIVLSCVCELADCASILSINHGIVPPTINHRTSDENIDPDLNLTLNKAQKRSVEVAMSNTFGFGGHNACVVFKKFDA